MPGDAGPGHNASKRFPGKARERQVRDWPAGGAKYKIHITLGITKVSKVPMVAESLPVPPQIVGADKPVPHRVVAIGGVHGSAMGQARNRVAGKPGAPVEGIPRRGKETRVTDTGTSTPQRYRG